MVKAEAMDPAQVFEANLLNRQKAMNEAIDRGDSIVQQFYCSAVVFVTGGTGFLGKQLMEKLIRATKISKVFVLIRPKKGKAIQQRLNETLQDPVYDMLKEQQPHFMDKIVPVAGDVAELRLGMSDKDWNTITEQVDIIFHMAATTRFDEVLRVSTIINVRGTREALALGKACKKLRSYVHVSTAYSHACENLINTEISEDFCPSPIDPKAMIKLAETLDEERLNAIAPSLTKNWPNTYSYAKAVAEETVRTMSGDLPICVVRPAIVISACREPNPGWVDMSNVYGASGMILGSGLGVMHVVMANSSIKIGLVPVDYTNNAIIAAAWETAKRKAAGEFETKVYTVTTSTRNPTYWGELSNIMNNVIKIRYPSPVAVGFNFVLQTSSVVVFWVYALLLHLIPGYIIDGAYLVLGKEKRFVKLYTKMHKMLTALSYFTVNDWKFIDRNTAELYNKLSTVDQEIFEFDVKKIDWQEYMIMWGIGLRKYIVKDGLIGTNYAIKKQYAFKILTYIAMPIYFYLLFKVFCLMSTILCHIFL